ncbi:MAG: PepSY domain-containing protein [Vicinamibacterales bacterium]
MTGVRSIVFWLHLAAGVTAGAVILVMSVTGALLALKPQILNAVEKEVRLRATTAAAGRCRRTSTRSGRAPPTRCRRGARSPRVFRRAPARRSRSRSSTGDRGTRLRARS